MSSPEDLAGLYAQSLEEKTKKLYQILEKFDYSPQKLRVEPSSWQGFRLRGKFKIYSPQKIMGTDPLKGEVHFFQSLWLFPYYLQKAIRKTVALIVSRWSNWPVDGFEIRGGYQNREVFLVLSVKRSYRQKAYEALANLLLEKVPFLVGVAIPSQKNVFGAEFITHYIFGRRIISHYQAFFQANPHLISTLVTRVKEMVSQLDFPEVYDLYCGVGLFSLLCVPPGKRISGIDINTWAVESARLNALNLSRPEASFFCQEVEEFLEISSLSRRSLFMVNPPRSGCRAQVINRLLTLKPTYLCFICCSFPALEKNVTPFVKKGYRILSLAAFDQFPFAPFLETITFLRR
jgi:tRNA/tmRNA/rRNA uracil-C5-methylase (TrmA/RlmC/RlmD family)